MVNPNLQLAVYVTGLVLQILIVSESWGNWKKVAPAGLTGLLMAGLTAYQLASF